MTRSTRPARPVRAAVAGLATVTALTALSTAPANATEKDGDGIRDRQLDRLISQVHRDGAIGVTAELVTPDGTWRGAAGSAERKPRTPATEDARFRAASVSKQLVTVLALQLVESGEWSLDTTIGDVRPNLWPGREDVTLRQLLSHTSGLPEYLLPLVADAVATSQFLDVISVDRTDRELVDLARSQPATAQPGEFSYANTNFVVTGMLLEKATGTSLETLMRKRILEPTGMTRSSWATSKAMPERALQEYGRLYGEVVSLRSFEPSMFSGAGALLTTARDLNRFQAALSRGELVERRLVRKMRQVISPELEYGLGSYRLPDPCRPGRFVHGHDGGSWGTVTLSFASPRGDRRVAVSMTGRDYDGNNDAVKAASKLATYALAQTCGGKPLDGAGARAATVS